VTEKDRERRAPRVDEGSLTAWSELADEDDLVDTALTGDFAGADLSLVAVRQSRLEGVAFTGARLVRASFVDCVIVDSEWSGATLEDCRFERVELRRCRMSGVQAHGSRFSDVALIDCKADEANFRMTEWEHGELRDSHLVDADFYGARMPRSRVHGCDLTNVDLSKCDLSGSRLHGSRLDRIRGGEGLRGVTVGSDQLIPTALAVFGSLGISVDDESPA
jgi:Pentapeptide repeats (9 copies)/Pentapeptide repeats (8 copies)